jgi:hypothetical protein
MRTRMILIVLAAIAFSTMVLPGAPLAAGEYRNEISVSLGGATFPDITETAKEIGGIIGTIGLLREESERDIPAVVFNYGRYTSEHLRLGLSFCYQKFNVNYYLSDNFWFKTGVSYYTFMARGDYTWLDTKWADLYSGAAIGMSFVSEEEVAQKTSDTETWVAFHVNALGIRVGRQLAGFLELGFGYNGIAAIGLTAGF